MKEIKLHYTEELFRQALWAKHFPSLKDYRAWIVPVILLSGGCFVLLPFVLGKHDWILVVGAIAMVYKVILRIRTYRKGLPWMLRAFRDGIYEGWTLSYTEEELTVRAESFKQKSCATKIDKSKQKIIEVE